MSEEKATVSLDGKDYVIDELPERAKYILGQLQDLEQQGRATRARLDQIEVARGGFTDLLRKELSESE